MPRNVISQSSTALTTPNNVTTICKILDGEIHTKNEEIGLNEGLLSVSVVSVLFACCRTIHYTVNI